MKQAENWPQTGAIMTTAECLELSSCPPLEGVEDNSKIEPQKFRKIQIDQYGQTKGCYRGF